MSRKWEDELRQKGGGALRDKGPIAKYGSLECPFSLLFKSDVPVYLKPDFTFTYTNDGDYQAIGDIQNLLSDDKYVIGWAEDVSERPKLSEGPVFFLQVKDIQDGSMNYFTLPLSERGIDIFKNSLSGLLGYSDGGNTALEAVITDAGQLAVTLIVEIDGEKVTLNTREYEIDWMTDQGRVIMWPNFVSEKWNKYYLYSEFTADAKQQFTPIFKWQNELLRNIEGNFLTADYVPTPEEEKKVEKKIQPKNISKSMKVMKKESTWAPTTKKKLGPIGKSLVETKKINKANYGSNNPSKKVTGAKNKVVKK